MDASALARELDNLENSWSSLDWWLNFWTILVVIGVAVELFVIITEYSHDWRDFKRGTIHSPDKPCILMFGLGFLGAALVAIGVAGEFRIHVKAGKIESDMRSKGREMVGIANREASEAKERAANAELRSTELLAQIEPRDLTLKQQRQIGETLRQFSGRRRVTMFSYIGDAEAYRLCRQIDASLQYARLTHLEMCSSNALGPRVVPSFGVHVMGAPVERGMLTAIRAALRSIGNLNDVTIHPDLDASSESMILVGVKPFPGSDATRAPEFIRIGPGPPINPR